MALTRVCKKYGCGRTAIPGIDYCPRHEDLQNQKRKIFTKRGNSSKWHHLYESAEWRRKSKAFLEKYPYCCICGQPSKITDHIQPHRGDLYIFWNEENWQPLCVSCHSRKTLKENNNFHNTTDKEKKSKKGDGGSKN